MGVDCLKCINSACCSLVIEVTIGEYNSLHESVKNEFVKHSDKFISTNREYEGKQEFLDSMYSENFAEMKKSEDGLCTMLDRETMLCTVYENRPKVCVDYNNNRCEKIRELCMI